MNIFEADVAASKCGKIYVILHTTKKIVYLLLIPSEKKIHNIEFHNKIEFKRFYLRVILSQEKVLLIRYFYHKVYHYYLNISYKNMMYVDFEGSDVHTYFVQDLESIAKAYSCTEQTFYFLFFFQLKKHFYIKLYAWKLSLA